MTAPEHTVQKVIDAASMQLIEQDEFVTPTTQLSVIHNWLKAWTLVATTPTDQELLEALTMAYDRVFCKVHDIQF